ncbi:MAG: RtcB family protein [Clostridiaceae bacterium]|nr:RtcB family protein [Clostridiaceae bacterium]
MQIITGRYNSAKVFTDNLDPKAVDQIEHLLDQPFTSGSRIRIMPDAHVGAGCTIGTTMTVQDKVVPNMVGVDIGCGMETAVLADSRLDPGRLDKLIHAAIPSGFDIRDRAHAYNAEIDLERLRCREAVHMKRAVLSIGTLGGGNHFIEVDRDDQDRLYLVVHSGSRNLGKQTAEYYQHEAAARLSGQGIEKSLAYCEGALFRDYLHDMSIIQRYADLNRKAIMQELLSGMKLSVTDRWTTIHNYIDLDTMILRKGAISARAGERILIPINMRDGSLICLGKGNPDWNQSAPHGAGRLMSRTQARQIISLSEYKKSMEGIYSSTVNADTVDEAAFAYKPLEEILGNIADTAEVIRRILPVYNFKAAE